MLVRGRRFSADLQYVVCSAIVRRKPNSVAVLNFRWCKQDAVAGHDLRGMDLVQN